MVRHSVRRTHAKKHVDKRLQRQLRLYFFIAVAMIAIVIFNLVTGRLDFNLSVFGIGGGLLMGIISARMFHISWSHDAQKVVSQFDKFGGIVLAFYIIVEISREWLFSHYLGAITVALTFAFLAGVMIGRFVGTRGKILKVLKEQEVF